MTEKKRRKSLSRQDWLEEALQILSLKGAHALTIDAVVQQLGVTKGSFYYHFTDRADFIHALVIFWDEKFTRIVGEKALDSAVTPEEMLWRLMLEIDKNELTKYDIPIRAWAERNTQVHEIVVSVDKYRLNIVRTLFVKMGFKGLALEARTRSFVTTMSLEFAITNQAAKSSRRKYLKALHDFFTQR